MSIVVVVVLRLWW